MAIKYNESCNEPSYIEAYKRGVNSSENWGHFDKNNPTHTRIRAQVANAGHTVPHPRHVEVADMLGWFNEFLRSPRSPVKKPLMQMNKVELEKVIKAMGGIVIFNNSTPRR